MKCVVFIPARLESKRFPNKIIKKIYGIPMVEHVRRRAIVSKAFDDVFVVSNSINLKKKLEKYFAKVILTKKRHLNGTSRVSEIANRVEFDYAIILFGDEPFIDPDHLKSIVKKIKKDRKSPVFNVTTNLKNNDLLSPEVVKTIIDKKNYIKDYFRLSKNKINQNIKLIKSSGVIVMSKDLIKNYKNIKVKQKEKNYKIEQFRFLENHIKIKSIFVKNIYPSVNTKKELTHLLSQLKNDKKQKKIINRIINFEN